MIVGQGQQRLSGSYLRMSVNTSLHESEVVDAP